MIFRQVLINKTLAASSNDRVAVAVQTALARAAGLYRR